MCARLGTEGVDSFVGRLHSDHRIVPAKFYTPIYQLLSQRLHQVARIAMSVAMKQDRSSRLHAYAGLYRIQLIFIEPLGIDQSQ